MRDGRKNISLQLMYVLLDETFLLNLTCSDPLSCPGSITSFVSLITPSRRRDSSLLRFAQYAPDLAVCLVLLG